ncbi:enolase C-terminal domain-like protein [Microbacterium sp. NPDC055903]
MSRIKTVEVIPLAFADPPLLNTWGVHEPLALRTLVVITLDDGTVGLGEAGGDLPVLTELRAVAPSLTGARVDDSTAVRRAVDELLGPRTPEVRRNIVGSPFEVAFLDAWGRLEGVPVVELLGGAVRRHIEYSGYLFYKWAGHPGHPDDGWGPALDPDGIVRLARAMVEGRGFRSLKLKAGVYRPEEEIAAMRALADAFPESLLRIDPNGAWTESTAVRVSESLNGIVDYVEDPVLGIDAMARVRAATDVPLASNMIVNTHQDLEEVVAASALDIVLADHHYWGGPRRALDLARACSDAGLGVSMHSNSHLGVSLAAMTHVAAASADIAYASDTHYPWNADDDIIVDPFVFTDGGLALSDRPGLGVELDRAKVERLHAQYVRSGRQVRDDTGYVRTVDPTFDARLPRF